MALIEMDFASGVGGGINPTEFYNSTYNVQVNGQQITGFTVGKTYAVEYQTSNAASTTVTGADIIGNEVFLSNGAGWGTSAIQDRMFFIKATSTTVTFTNASNSMYGLLIVEL